MIWHKQILSRPGPDTHAKIRTLLWKRLALPSWRGLSILVFLQFTPILSMKIIRFVDSQCCSDRALSWQYLPLVPDPVGVLQMLAPVERWPPILHKWSLGTRQTPWSESQGKKGSGFSVNMWVSTFSLSLSNPSSGSLYERVVNEELTKALLNVLHSSSFRYL